MDNMKENRKCLLDEAQPHSISHLEDEWARYKYLILARDPNAYKAIRVLLKNKSAYPVREFFDIVDAALQKDENTGYEINAAQHVFGYFRKLATDSEKAQVLEIIANYSRGDGGLIRLKSALFHLAKKYDVEYLLESYYFYGVE